jgi:hypothetical protein
MENAVIVASRMEQQQQHHHHFFGTVWADALLVESSQQQPRWRARTALQVLDARLQLVVERFVCVCVCVCVCV